MTDTKTSSSGGLFDLLTEEGTYGVDLSVLFFFEFRQIYARNESHTQREGSFQCRLRRRRSRVRVRR